MKVDRKPMAIICLALLISASIFAQSVTVNLTTVSYQGVYKPAHCFAMWISDTTGAYIRTINYQGSTYKQYLTYCNAAALASSKVTTDGVTGESLPVHNWKFAYPSTSIKRIPFTWDCTDQSGIVVPYGKYYVNVEYTEDNATGRFIQFEFAVGSTSQTYTRANETTDPGKWFSNMSVVYTAPAGTDTSSTLLETSTSTFDFIVYSVTEDVLIIQSDNPNNPITQIQVFTLKGQKVYDTGLSIAQNKVEIGTKKWNGIHVIHIKDSNGNVSCRKVYVK